MKSLSHGLLVVLVVLPAAAAAQQSRGGGTNPWAQGAARVLFDYTLKEIGKAESPFCWRDSYLRPVGTLAQSCDEGYERGSGGSLLCYPKCREGYRSDGVALCYKKCPEGSWSPGFCHVGGTIFTRRCPAGTSGLPPSCIFRDDPYSRGAGTPTKCAPGMDRDGPVGLCYPPCKPGYYGVGSVCWQSCPAGQPSACGMACAATSGQCAENVINQVVTPLEVVANVVATVLTAGGSTAATAGAKTAAGTAKAAGTAAAKAAARAAVRASVKTMARAIVNKVRANLTSKLLKKYSREVAESVMESAAQSLATAALAQDIDLAEFALDLDPTGVGSVVNAYNKPKCSPDEDPPTVPAAAVQAATAAFASWDGDPAGPGVQAPVVVTSMPAVDTDFRLVPVPAPDKVACVAGAGTQNGVHLHSWDDLGKPDQRWRLEPASGGGYLLKVRHTNKCLDWDENAGRNGSKVQQWDCHGGPNQVVDLVPQGAGYAIKVRSSGRCLDLGGGSRENGTGIQAWDCHGGPNQTWIFSPGCELPPGKLLITGQSLSSCNGQYRFILQGDGNLCLYTSAGQFMWCTMTNGKGASRLIMQDDGNLCLYTDSGGFVWCSRTTVGQAGTRLVVQNDGNVCTLPPSGAATWCTNTAR